MMSWSDEVEQFEQPDHLGGGVLSGHIPTLAMER
jgi:hypothetical protein